MTVTNQLLAQCAAMVALLFIVVFKPRFLELVALCLLGEQNYAAHG